MKMQKFILNRIIITVQFIFLIWMFSFSQIYNYRKLPELPESKMFKVEVAGCDFQFKNVYTYEVNSTRSDVFTKFDHISFFGFDDSKLNGITLKISAINGDSLNRENFELGNKTYKGIKVSYDKGKIFVRVCKPLKSLMFRQKGKENNPLTIFIDDKIEKPVSGKVFTFEAKDTPHVISNDFDRFTVPNDVNVVYIEDGALVKGTIWTASDRSTPLKVIGKGVVIGNGPLVSGAAGIPYNTLELNHGIGHEISGITILKSRHFGVRASENTKIRNVKIIGYDFNNDGIVAGTNSIIEYCFFKVNDDHVKLYNNNMIVRKCVFYEQNNGGLIQFAWNSIDPGDNCLFENCEVLAWESTCGDPQQTTGGLARTFINHRQSLTTGKKGSNNVVRNVLIQGKVDRFIGLNGWNDAPITYENLKVENINVINGQQKPSWIYAGENEGEGHISVLLSNVYLGQNSIAKQDIKTSGIVDIRISQNAGPFLGPINDEDPESCGCISTSLIQEDKTEIYIYPNPANGIVNLQKMYENVVLSDGSGNTLKSYRHVDTIDVSDLSKGVYFISLSSKKKGVIGTKKLIIK